jgi:hypothetical protein
MRLEARIPVPAPLTYLYNYIMEMDVKLPRTKKNTDIDNGTWYTPIHHNDKTSMRKEREDLLLHHKIEKGAQYTIQAIHSG